MSDPSVPRGFWVMTICGLFSDEVIGQVLSTMRAQAVPYTAIYSGLRPSRVSTQTRRPWRRPAG